MLPKGHWPCMRAYFIIWWTIFIFLLYSSHTSLLLYHHQKWMQLIGLHCFTWLAIKKNTASVHPLVFITNQTVHFWLVLMCVHMPHKKTEFDCLFGSANYVSDDLTTKQIWRASFGQWWDWLLLDSQRSVLGQQMTVSGLIFPSVHGSTFGILRQKITQISKGSIRCEFSGDGEWNHSAVIPHTPLLRACGSSILVPSALWLGTPTHSMYPV